MTSDNKPRKSAETFVIETKSNQVGKTETARVEKLAREYVDAGEFTSFDYSDMVLAFIAGHAAGRAEAEAEIAELKAKLQNPEDWCSKREANQRIEEMRQSGVRELNRLIDEQRQNDIEWASAMGDLRNNRDQLKAKADALVSAIQDVLDETWILTAQDRDRWQSKLRDALQTWREEVEK